MLLCLPQRPKLPVRHLLSFANLFANQLCCHLGEAYLVIEFMYFHVVALHVNEVGEFLVKTHRREKLLEHVKVAVEREPYAECVTVGEHLRQDAI